ncbi:hypothetical protein [Halobacillus sp. B29]|uniref:hypothetical protein n=1 Tax=Halobacillus sp. B29 TaxID=3457432 RepID=UPI003FCEB917
MVDPTKLKYKKQKNGIPCTGEFYLQKDESYKSKGSMTYSIVSKEKEIGRVAETDKGSSSLGNNLLKILSSLFLNIKGINLEAFDLSLLDQDGYLIASIRKKAGFFADFNVYTKFGKHLATIQYSTRKNSPTISVIGPDGKDQFLAWIQSNLIDFSIEDKQTGEEFSTIQKRSLVHSTIRENLTSNDAFFVNNNQLNQNVNTKLISIVVALDMYYYMGQ